MKYIDGDILEITDGFIVHQVNCQGVMGAGLAKEIRKKYKVVYDVYSRTVRGSTDKKHLLGHSEIIYVTEKLMVVNLYGQLNYGTGERQTDYNAFEQALQNFAQVYNTAKKYITSPMPVYFPYKIGCGLAGGDWKIISELIEHYFEDAIIIKYKEKEGK